MRYLLTLLALGACTSAPDVDQNGNVYPATCSQEATDKVTVPLLVVPRDSPLLPVIDGRRALGYARPLLLVVSDGLGGWKLADAKRHERCHVIAGEWHK